jgi:serine phosphatase RsbU (regulator of sigma subunit)/uncharacterized protein YneF (UPF0154 family)
MEPSKRIPPRTPSRGGLSPIGGHPQRVPSKGALQPVKQAQSGGAAPAQGGHAVMRSSPSNRAVKPAPAGSGRAQAEPQAAREDDSGAQGMSLAMKLILAVSLAVGVACIVMLFVAYFIMIGQMDQEINEAGIRMATTLSAFDISMWDEIERQRISGDFKKLDGELRRLFKEEGDGSTAKDPMVSYEKLCADLERMSASSKESVGNLTTGKLGVLDIVVVKQDPASKNLNRVFKIKEGGIVPTSVNNIKREKGITVDEFWYKHPTQGDVKTRVFRKDIVSKEGTVQGQVWLCLSAQRIDEAKNRMLVGLLAPLLLAIVIGAGIGFYISTKITKPVKTLVEFNRMTKSLKLAQSAELERQAMEHDLNIATEIQSNLLPKKVPRIPGFDIGAFYRPSKEVGGDYYDFMQKDEDNLALIVADVSGKGIPGSMVMTMARSLIRMEAERNSSAADTLIKVNRVLAKDIRRGMFVTALYVILNTKTKSMLVSSAGHNPLLLYRKATGTYELINPNGIALGFDKGPIFERTIKEQKVDLYPGDRFVMYTDGVVEAMNEESEEFGDERFFKLVAQLADKDSNQFVNMITRALDEHKGTAQQHDDITLASVRVVG